MTPLVIVRPEPAASATAAAARRLGLGSVVLPLFELEPVDWKAPDLDTFDALLLTSANAFLFGGSELERLKPLDAHCVGEATAEAARKAGFAVATVGSRGVDSLLEALPPGLRLLHLGGTDRREPAEARQAITAIPVYRAMAIDPPAALVELADAVVAVHSPRAAARLASIAAEKASISIAAISQAAAESAGTGWKQVRIASEPADSALLALAAELCNNPA